MYPDATRRQPVQSTIYSLIFPGYFLWREGRKVEGISLTLGVFLGYIIILGLIFHIYILHLNWKKSMEFNSKNGFQSLTESEKQNLVVTGSIAGIFAHPVYLLLAFVWIIQTGYVNRIGILQVNIPAYIMILIILYLLRYFLYHSIWSVRSDDDDPDYLTTYKEFARNHSSSIIIIPLFYLFVSPLTDLNATLLFWLLPPFILIFGTRILYNNLKTLDFI